MNSDGLEMAVEGDCDRILREIARRLRSAGYPAERTFDLRAARAVQTDCPCPHHGTAQCDCQMVVLLAYIDSGPPVSLVAHGNGGRCRVSVVASPGQSVPALNLAFLGDLLADLSAQPEQDVPT